MKVTVTVSQASDGKYWCHTENAVCNGYMTATGRTVADAKRDLLTCWEDMKADLQEHGTEIPNIEFEYKYDLQSFFEYFSFLNITEIAKRAGINPSLMRQYSRGIKNAGEKTYNRLSVCMEGIIKELQAASF